MATPLSNIHGPANDHIETANLESIDLSKLNARVPNEVARLLAACATDGFFYLKLQDSSAGQMLEDGKCLEEFMEKYFAQSQAAKMKDDRNSLILGLISLKSVVLIIIVTAKWEFRPVLFQTLRMVWKVSRCVITLYITTH